MGGWQVNINDAIKGLDLTQKDARKVVQATLRGVKGRAPGNISGSVRKMYNVSPADVKDNVRTYRGDIKIQGETFEGFVLYWKDRRFTFGHKTFGLKAKASKKSPYVLSAKIHKGGAVTIHGKSQYPGKPFMAQANNSPPLAFQRMSRKKTKASKGAYKGKLREPLEALRTLSVPEMITDKQGNLRGNVQEGLDELIESRFKNSCERFLGK
jgi:hypothetical protein